MALYIVRVYPPQLKGAGRIRLKYYFVWGLNTCGTAAMHSNKAAFISIIDTRYGYLTSQAAAGIYNKGGTSFCQREE